MKKDLLLGLGIGFFGGVLVGGLTALLLAPVSGEEMRGEIRDSAESFGALHEGILRSGQRLGCGSDREAAQGPAC